MLMPRSARVSNILAAMPALERMPMPTALIFTTSVSVMIDSNPIVSFAFSSAATAWASEALGTVRGRELALAVAGARGAVMSTWTLAAASGAGAGGAGAGGSGGP